MVPLYIALRQLQWLGHVMSMPVHRLTFRGLARAWGRLEEATRRREHCQM